MSRKAYGSTDKGSYKNSDISGRFRWTDVFVKRNGRWEIVAGQGTRIISNSFCHTAWIRSNRSCAPGRMSTLWHCNAYGVYSDESAYNADGGRGTVVTTAVSQMSECGHE